MTPHKTTRVSPPTSAYSWHKPANRSETSRTIPIVLSLHFHQQFIPPGQNQIVWAQSPNCDPRPAGSLVDTIVLHHTAGETLESTVAWFSSSESRVSAHFTVGRDGSIVQHVSTYQRAWHAGDSIDIYGREWINANSVGIEIVHSGTPTDGYTVHQTDAVEHLVSVMVRRFPIRLITSHAAVARPLGRKNDPVNYPWHTLSRFGVTLVP